MAEYISYDLERLMILLNSKRPFNPITAKSIQDHFYLKYNQQSNAIEGNSLTLSETKVLLENGITAKGKPFKDHLDIINHRNAIYYLQDLIKENLPLSERIIKEFNLILLKSTENEREAGQYRKMPVMITGTSHIPPQPYLLQSKMENLVLNYQDKIQQANDLEKIVCIAQLHAEFVRIHPFIDGNGRTGRLVMNFELLKQGYPLAIISAEKREEYYQALAKTDNGDDREIIEVVINAIKQSTIEMLNVVFPTWLEHY